jgi:hypothetical protein
MRHALLLGSCFVTGEKPPARPRSTLLIGAMHFSTSHRPRSVVGVDHVCAPNRANQPHAVTVSDIAVACAAMDYRCATWSSQQVDAAVARDIAPSVAGSCTRYIETFDAPGSASRHNSIGITACAC